MTHAQKKFLIMLLLACICIITALWYITRHNTENTISQNKDTVTLSLSTDKSTIFIDKEPLIDTQNPSIYEFFQEEICKNNSENENFESWCNDSGVYYALTAFTNLEQNSDGFIALFEIQTQILTPDKGVGIIKWENGHDAKKEITMLTNYYLGNEIIGFSPDEKYFALRQNCFEAKCGIFVYNTDSLEIVKKLNTPEYADSRENDITFLQWKENDTIEYSIDSETFEEKL